MASTAFVLQFSIALFFFTKSSQALSSATEQSTISPPIFGSIAFAAVGRTEYAFDLYSLPSPSLEAETNPSVNLLELGMTRKSDKLAGIAESHRAMLLETEPLKEIHHTAGPSVNYNGQFIPPDSKLREVLSKMYPLKFGKADSSSPDILFVSERSENIAEVFFQEFGSSSNALQLTRGLALHDHPRVIPGSAQLLLLATEEPSGKPRQGWTAVYKHDFESNKTMRLTPKGITDYSPAVSHSGKWVAVASTDGHPWQREFTVLPLDIFIFRSDGSQRRLIATNGSWPSFGSDDKTLYFHRAASDGWYSIFKVELPEDLGSIDEPLDAERVTSPGLHVLTPAAAPSGKFLAVTTRRPPSVIRHVEVFDLEAKKIIPLTELVHPGEQHYSPFVSHDSSRIGYHRCRAASDSVSFTELELEGSLSGKYSTRDYTVPNLEVLRSPQPGLSLLRASGDFPVFSPSGTLVAMIPTVGVPNSGVVVMNIDGTDRREVFRGAAFGLSWNPVKNDTLYTSCGGIFASEDTSVQIVAISNADKGSLELAERRYNLVPRSRPTWRALTKSGTGNNAFPAVSHDGKRVVFRSGRSGHKNLYIMDAQEGEEAYLQRLTDGPWTDTMPSWSPDGKWIAFSSDRELQGTFGIYLVHPNGSGLHKLFCTGPGGRSTHPFFSPDSTKLVFTTDYAGISAEPVTMAHQYQPYGEIYLINLDGTGLIRMTHNQVEDGTPSWGAPYIGPEDTRKEGKKVSCDFRDFRYLTGPVNTVAFSNTTAICR